MAPGAQLLFPDDYGCNESYSLRFNSKERVAHGLPYLEILKGWLKDSIFTRQHKMVHELPSSLLFNQNALF